MQCLASNLPLKRWGMLIDWIIPPVLKAWGRTNGPNQQANNRTENEPATAETCLTFTVHQGLLKFTHFLGSVCPLSHLPMDNHPFVLMSISNGMVFCDRVQ